MSPATGGRLLRFVGDRLAFRLRFEDGRPLPEGWRAFLRTNLGRAAVLRHQVIHTHTGKLKFVDASWRDLPLRPADDAQWEVDLPLTEVGYFRAKAYAVDPRGWQHWPAGPDFGVSVHADSVRTANTIYCAFVRMFGESGSASRTRPDPTAATLAELDRRGYVVIPASGKLRDLTRQLPHILGTLGCRVLHLLPVNPTPTVSGRFGRFGSPYAAQDLTAIDPALVEFDKRTTGVDQFRELTYAAHLRGGRVFLDLVINHTGWGARLQEAHPEWYVRSPDGSFVSPGAWGVTWEDLVELNQNLPDLWEHIAEVLLTWCRRGVDGFRCDAGYKIPVPAWQYITARVLDEFPETVFLLEGLGGSWEATESLLTNGGMQWAYSELFQNYTGRDVRWYLDYSLRQCEQVGLYVHYSETHDNDRLAAHAHGRAWSLLRNRLCALTSVSGGFGFTAGVEWLAAEKIKVHECSGLNWGAADHLVAELAQLNRLVADHPCFLDGAVLRRLSADDSPVYALSRVSAEGLDRVLVLVNTDCEHPHSVELDIAAYRELGQPAFDLLSRQPVQPQASNGDEVSFELEAGACLCLAHGPQPRGLSGEAYRKTRAQAAWATTALSQILPTEQIGPCDWRELARRVDQEPARLLAALAHLDPHLAASDLLAALDQAAPAHYPTVVRWRLLDAGRVTLVPPGHWLLLHDPAPFRAHLTVGGKTHHVHSIWVDGWSANDADPEVRGRPVCIASFPPGLPAGEAELVLERFAPEPPQEVKASLRFLSPLPDLAPLRIQRDFATDAPTLARAPGLVLLTNGLGGMARLQVDFGSIRSKYDCALGANLHPNVPVDRHVFVKRVRAWVVADGFISPLDGESLIQFSPGPPAEWVFVAGAGDGRAVEIHLTADMLPDSNTTVLRLHRPPGAPRLGRDLPADRHVNLTVRVDLLDRNFHSETHHNGDAERHFGVHTHPLAGQIGFAFTPAAERQLRAFADTGAYHHDGEWCLGVPHPVEATRGQVASEDTFSPGWFDLPMPKNGRSTLTLSAEWNEPAPETLQEFAAQRRVQNQATVALANLDVADAFGRQLALAVQAFVVRRGLGKTIIAGYPWFLDWGRDSLICARGLLAAGMVGEVKELLEVFGRFEERGTLPNRIHGEDASNRDTSDAPLWFGVVCEEVAAHHLARTDLTFYDTRVSAAGRTIADVLRSIAVHYIHGTPNGIRVDPDSGLVFSPTHFTWMDTLHPACTPREGYAVEIQALWIRLLRQLARLDVKPEGQAWSTRAEQAEASFHKFFTQSKCGCPVDVLLAPPGTPAADAQPDGALRSNGLLAVSLGLLTGEAARRCVEAARLFLVVPGALRSLAPLRVSPPLPIHAPDGRLLNQPDEPYWSRYEGDEDTSRKPAYHNGTAWVWTFPTFCEALALAWDFAPAAVAAARSYLGSLDRLLIEGCRGQLPEIMDGDAPHTQRGCDAQAWSVTEALRVWKLLHRR